ncbi:unnamed protein product [Porites evermanni]|uniref:Peptidase S8/S53 domain-containing protein n=1 Tax=Porites evermanni TaxID=104178 RepID=A0ABN8PLL4_9CNID|nr:unnamed protein product [Porites evermanni]
MAVTADANMGCTNSFGASSAAAAMASGLIALMLSATKVLKHRRKSPWVPILTGPFPNGQANAGWLADWAQKKNALYYYVQHIIAWTARQDPVAISKSSWTVNKANLSVNDYVGFGFMDATKMVDAALKWTTVPANVNCTIPDPRGNSPIMFNESFEDTIDLSWTLSFTKPLF